MSEQATAPHPTVLSDEEFLQQFESTAWSVQEWHHRQHVKVAYLYLRRFPLEAASTRIRERIKAFNAAKQLAESWSSGYHETMTQAWLRLVYFTLCEYGPADDAERFYEQHPELWGKQVLRFYYTRERFMSAEGKAEFLEPDITPLPQSKKAPPELLK
jgi:hypothetical protein